MGQKVHPLGFRLVTTQTHRSKWFSKFQTYPLLLEEDTAIRDYLNQMSREAGISKIKINRNGQGNKLQIEILSARPGILVGKDGVKLSEIYKNLTDQIKHVRAKYSDSQEVTFVIKIVKLEEPDTEAALIGDFVVEQLEKRVAFRRAIRKSIKRAQVANIAGVKIQIGGRLNGAEIARKEWIREGRVPLHTLRADIDYAEKRANTVYGVLGVKVWLFKSEIL